MQWKGHEKQTETETLGLTLIIRVMNGHCPIAGWAVLVNVCTSQRANTTEDSATCLAGPPEGRGIGQTEGHATAERSQGLTRRLSTDSDAVISLTSLNEG